MHLHFERIERPNSFLDTNILSLSWMGKVPDGLLQSEKEDGWKLNRTNYYQDGWVAIGNKRGIVGVTYTSCRCRKASLTDLPLRTNYNLRGHRSQVTLVKWNEPYQKLATCDASGMIFVWIKYEGRWSVELINDRNIQVTDFSWSHDGRMALICYIDGFVLIGSVAGQRYWSSMLNLESCFTTCGIWTPDDQQVIFGTSNGSLLVVDINGTFVSQVVVREDHSISSMSWSAEKFKMEDSDDESISSVSQSKSYMLAISFEDGTIYLIKNYDDIFPIIINTNLGSIKIEWSNKGEILAVGGHQIQNDSKSLISYINKIQLYTVQGVLRYVITMDYASSPITALTWGHNDKRLFVGTGSVLHTAWVTKKMPTLHLLCRLAIYLRLSNENDVESLQLPSMLQAFVSNLFGRTLRCYLPDIKNLINFVIQPPQDSIRLYCTLIRRDDHLIGDSSSYILYLEYLGGLLPILKGKRTSKFRPEFVIFDPQLKIKPQIENGLNKLGNDNQVYWYNSLPSSENEMDNQLTPRVRRKRRLYRLRSDERNRDNQNGAINIIGRLKPEDGYLDELADDDRLILITSNIWGTKFKILGLVPWLPSQLGSVAYRTSLLHLQPRQMTLRIKELGGPGKLASSDSFTLDRTENNAYISSDDDEELKYITDDDVSIPIAPMTPKKVVQRQPQLTADKRYYHCTKNSLLDKNYSFSDYSNYFLNLEDEMLTLQINRDLSEKRQYLTYDMANTSSRSAPKASNSISTQTSFQSINDLFNGLILNETKEIQNLIEDKSKCVNELEKANDQTMQVKSTIEQKRSKNKLSNKKSKNELKLEDSVKNESDTQNGFTQNRFTQMTKNFADDLPCTSKNPLSQSLLLNHNEILQPFQPLSNNFSKNIPLYSSKTSPDNLPNNLPDNLSQSSLRYPKYHKDFPKMSKIFDTSSQSENCDIKENNLKFKLNATQHNDTRRTSSTFLCDKCDSKIKSASARPSVFQSTSSSHSKQPVHGSKTIHDLKSIDKLQTNENDSNCFLKSPSLLVHKNCHSFAQSLFKDDFNCESEFTNIRGTQENVNCKEQPRYTLLKSKSVHNVINNTSNSKERVPNCMSLDDKEDDMKDLTFFETECICNQDLYSSCKEVSKLESFKRFENEFSTSHDISRPVQLPPKNLLNFDGKEVFKSLNESYSLLKPSKWSLNSSSSSIYSSNQEISKMNYSKNSLHNSKNGDGITKEKNSKNELNRSLPSSPSLPRAPRKADGKRLLYSPIMIRKALKQR